MRCRCIQAAKIGGAAKGGAAVAQVVFALTASDVLACMSGQIVANRSNGVSVAIAFFFDFFLVFFASLSFAILNVAVNQCEFPTATLIR